MKTFEQFINEAVDDGKSFVVVATLREGGRINYIESAIGWSFTDTERLKQLMQADNLRVRWTDEPLEAITMQEELATQVATYLRNNNLNGKFLFSVENLHDSRGKRQGKKFGI